MGIFSRFFKKDEIKVDKVIEKDATNDCILGVDDGRYISYNLKKGNYYNSNYIVNRGIQLLANNIAALPLRLYRGDTELPPDFTFPNGFSLLRPNTGMSLNELLYITCVYYFFRGEFCQHIMATDGPMRLIPLNPKRLNRGMDGNWKLDSTTIIQKEDLIYTAFLNPEINSYSTNNERGLSPIDVVASELDNDASAATYSDRFFSNYAQVGGTLIDKNGSATQQDMERMVNQFNAAHQSKYEAYKTLGLPQGIEYVEQTQTLREMEFLESRKDIRDRILIILGIHKALVGITDSVNRSVAEEAGRQMWAQTLKPAAVRIQEKYNQQLFNVYFPGYYCKFDFTGIKELQENMESILKQAMDFRHLGYTTNEINAHFKLDMEPIEDEIGDMRFVPSNLIPVNDLLLEEEEPKTPPKKEKVIAQVIDKRLATNYKNKYNKVERKVERKMHRGFNKYFSKQLYKILNKINKKAAKSTESIILADIRSVLSGENGILVKMVKPIYEDGSLDSSTLALATIKDAATPTINEKVVKAMTNKITNINNYTYKLIKNEVKKSTTAGESLSELSKRIVGVYKFNTSRARIIAATESSNLVNRTTYATYKEKKVEKKQWLATMDSVTRETHAENHNKGPVPLDYIYDNGLSFPGDPNGSAGEVISCRCCICPHIQNS